MFHKSQLFSSMQLSDPTSTKSSKWHQMISSFNKSEGINSLRLGRCAKAACTGEVVNKYDHTLGGFHGFTKSSNLMTWKSWMLQGGSLAHRECIPPARSLMRITTWKSHENFQNESPKLGDSLIFQLFFPKTSNLLKFQVVLVGF